MAWYDTLLWFLLWRKHLQTVCVMLNAALRMFTDFAYFCVRLLRTLCGSCIWIRLCFCARCADFAYVYSLCARCADFAYIYGLSFAHAVRILHKYTAHLHNVQCGQSRGIQSWEFLDFFCPCERLLFLDSLKGSNLEDFVDLFCLLEMIVIIVQSWGSYLEDSVDLFFAHELLVIHHLNSSEVS